MPEITTVTIVLLILFADAADSYMLDAFGSEGEYIDNAASIRSSSKKRISDGISELILDRTKRFAGWKQDTSKSGFTCEERIAILVIHNQLRRAVEATNMRHLVWDTGLEAVAQDWANGCDFVHNYGNNYGENLSAQASFFNETVVVQNWYGEIQYYTYSTNGCSNVCGHYTQTVLAESKKIGCGIKFCPTMKTITMSNGYNVVCNYDPAVNKGSSVPYEKGTHCANCPADTPLCDNNLCRSNPYCGDRSCNNGGVLQTDTCECNCAGTGYEDHCSCGEGPEQSTVSTVSTQSTQTPPVNVTESGAPGIHTRKPTSLCFLFIFLFIFLFH